MDSVDVVARKVGEAQLFGETGSGTLMGRLLRQFWHPVARVDSLQPGKARAVRLLAEDLTLYCGASGAFHLIDARCAHRGTLLHTGWVEGESLRCMYHGWRYDGSGLCTEIPAEGQTRVHPIHIAGYPTKTYAGLVFAYLGDAPTPAFDLPRKDALEDASRHLVVLDQQWDCNWFQQIENSLDPVHLAFAHRWGKLTNYGEGRKATATPTQSYEETSSGVRQRYSTGAKDRISDWTFPNYNHLIVPGAKPEDPWSEICAWTVPVDDETTIRYRVYSYPASGGEQARRVASESPDYNPADHYDALFNRDEAARLQALDVVDLQFFTAQDYVAMRGQGKIADRVNENLSVSDAGVMFLRKLFLREMEAIRAGRPGKRWAPLEQKMELPVQAAH
ncbi:MAG: Rieske 2Fe-2S domain-containing protein [Burkholderiales bacterium]